MSSIYGNLKAKFVKISNELLTALRTYKLPNQSGTIALLDDIPISTAQAADLIDGGDSALHYHTTDRALANATGTLDVTKGGTGTSTKFTAGSVVFAGANGVYSQNNSQLYWDAANNKLGIGTNTPTSLFEVNAGINDGIRINNGIINGVIFNSNNAYMSIGTVSNHPFVIITNNSPKFSIQSNGYVCIGSSLAQAILDIPSTTSGFLKPRMTTTQRDEISSLPEGLEIYNTTTKKMNFYDGTAWRVITSA